MAIALVQSNNGSGSGTGLTTAKTLPGAPTAGNLLLAFINLGTGTTETTITIDTTKWSYFDTAGNSETNVPNVIGLYRYVQVGDTSTLPAFATAGSAFHAWSVLEYSGVSGTWDTDFQGSRHSHSDIGTGTYTALSVPKFTTQSANVYAILAHAKYNRSANASLSAGWTSDINTNNSGNYGSWGVAHQVVSTSGTDIDATVTFQSASDPGGILMVFLQTAAPTNPYVRRTRNITNSSGAFAQTAQKFGGTVPNGNLMLISLDWNNGTKTAPTFNTTSWTSIADSGGGTPQIFVYGRIASSETITWPAIITAGSEFSSMTMLEIANVATSVGGTVVSTKGGTDTTNASFSTTSDTTTGNNQLGVTFYSEYNASSKGSVSGATIRVEDMYFSDFGWWYASSDLVASSGGTVQSTITKSSSTNHSGYVQLILTATVPPKVLTVDTQAYTYSPQATAFIFTRKVALSVTAYSYAPQDTNLTVGKRLGIDTNTYAVGAQDTGFLWFHQLAVAAQSYTVLGQDITLTPSFHRHFTFAEFRDGGFHDWGTESYSSYFNTCQSLDSPDLKTQTPWLYTFTTRGDNVGAFMQVQWDWHDSGVRVFPDLQVYNDPPNDNYKVSVSKTKVRGKGRQVHVKYSSDADKDFNILGWVIFYSTQAQQ